MQQRKTIRQLSRVRRFQFFFFLYWLHFSEAIEAFTPRTNAPLSTKLLHLTVSFMPISIMGIIAMKENPYFGMAITMAYSGSLAFYAIYSALRLRLAHQRVHWVGE